MGKTRKTKTTPTRQKSQVRDRRTTRSKDKIYDWIEEWRNRLYLSQFSFDVRFCKKDVEDDRGYLTKADIEVSAQYHKAYISIYPCLLGLSDRVQELSIAHELSHILTDPLYKAALCLTDSPCAHDALLTITEELTDMISIIAFSAKENGQKCTTKR